MTLDSAATALPPLTVCTVSYHHAAHLRLNFDEAAKRNPGADIRWIVAENTPAGSELRLSGDVPPNVEVIATEHIVPRHGRQAMHYHIAALQEAIARVDTRFMLILDPDFYPIRPHWYADVVSHMLSEGLALFGAPWNPRHHRKYRYFPCVHFTMVDRDRFPDAPYTPEVLLDPARRDWLKAAYDAPGVRVSTLRRKWRTGIVRRLFPARWAKSWAIQDTGSELFARYWTGEPIAAECLIPVFQPARLLKRKRLRSTLNRFFESIVPEYLSYVPKRPDSYSTDGGFLEATSATKDWEEFLWRGRPFGFHMRGNSLRSRRDAQAEVNKVEALLRRLDVTAP